jgi:class 3 adenylate cyclase
MDLRVAPQAEQDPTDKASTGARSAGTEASEKGQPFALLGFELRRVTRPNTKIVGGIEEVVLNRCVLAGVEVLTAAGAEIDVAGTAKRPMVESRFEGEDAAGRAARAAVAVLAAVRKVQRSAENEFQVVGALTVGAATAGADGVVEVTGGAEGLLRQLRERAAPGQILLSDGAKEATREVVEAVLARTPAGSRREASPAFVLRGLR